MSLNFTMNFIIIQLSVTWMPKDGLLGLVRIYKKYGLTYSTYFTDTDLWTYNFLNFKTSQCMSFVFIKFMAFILNCLNFYFIPLYLSHILLVRIYGQDVQNVIIMLFYVLFTIFEKLHLFINIYRTCFLYIQINKLNSSYIIIVITFLYVCTFITSQT